MNPTQTKPYTFKGGEALPQVGSEAYNQALGGSKPTGSYSAPPIPQTITSDLISGNAQSYTLPNPTKSSTATGIIESTASLNNSSKVQSEFERNRQIEMDKVRSEQDDLRLELASSLKELGLQGQNRIEAEEEAGIPQLLKEKNEIDSQIEAVQLSTRRRIEDIQKKGIGGTLAGQEDAIRVIERDGARELADLSIIQNARNRNLLTAQSLVNQKIELETEDLKNRRDNIKFFYEENKEKLDREDQRAFELATKQPDREYQETREKIKSLEETKLKLLTSASSQGANNQILRAIQNATTPDEAIVAAGQYGGDILARKIQQANLENIQSQIKERNTESGTKMNATQAVASGYADRMIEANKIIESSADKFASLRSYAGQNLPNFLKTEDRQKFEQAQRDFINAVLRKESGAAIADSEFASAKIQYFPQPGDSEGVVEQKRVNRLISTNALLKQAGLPPVEIQPTSTSPKQFQLPGGRVVTLQADGTYQ